MDLYAEQRVQRLKGVVPGTICFLVVPLLYLSSDTTYNWLGRSTQGGNIKWQKLYLLSCSEVATRTLQLPKWP